MELITFEEFHKLSRNAQIEYIIKLHINGITTHSYSDDDNIVCIGNTNP
jgi:hypothetical protein